MMSARERVRESEGRKPANMFTRRDCNRKLANGRKKGDECREPRESVLKLPAGVGNRAALSTRVGRRGGDGPFGDRKVKRKIRDRFIYGGHGRIWVYNPKIKLLIFVRINLERHRAYLTSAPDSIVD